jgi:hypothetical protein
MSLSDIFAKDENKFYIPPINVDISLPNDPKEMARKAREILMTISSSIPFKGFDIAYVREKSPKEEIEDVVSKIEAEREEIEDLINDILEDLETFELLSSATVPPTTSFKVRLETKLTLLVMKTNSAISEINRLISVFFEYTRMKVIEESSKPLLMRRGGE